MKITGANYSFIDQDGNVAGEAILFMRSRPPNADGTIGFMAEPGTREWLAWEAYFEQAEPDELGVYRQLFPKQLEHMRSRAAAKKPYMVPARVPWQFDKTFTADRVKPKLPVKMSKDMTQKERNAMAANVMKDLRDPEKMRQAAKRNWVEAMYRIGPDRDACTAILKSRPDLVEKATEAELAKHGLGWGEIRAEVEAIYERNRAAQKGEAA